MNYKIAFLFWAVMVIIAIANGFFGDLVVAKVTGGYVAHLYKTFLIIAVIFIGSRIFLQWSAAASGGLARIALYTGLQWLFSSIIFEFVFGHYVFGIPWQKLTADYRILEGRLWALVLASEVAAPLINAYLMGRIR